MVSRCLQAAEILANEGIAADVVNVSTIKPLDAEMIAACAGRTRAVVTAENHTVLGGLGGAVAEVLGEACPVPLRRVGIRDEFGTSGPLEEIFRSTASRPRRYVRLPVPRSKPRNSRA